MRFSFYMVLVGTLISSAPSWGRAAESEHERISPKRVTEPVSRDSDDPAIWINPQDPANSLILGTDKGGKVYVFDLQGRVQADKTVTGFGRPNNVDVEYGFLLGGKTIDIAVVTDRNRRLLRVFSVPDMTAIDGGGIPAFVGEAERRPMGIGLYKRPADGTIFAIVSRKGGPSGAYLWQYRLRDRGDGTVAMDKIRAFGEFTGGHEIEALVVDDELNILPLSSHVKSIQPVGVHPREKKHQNLGFQRNHLKVHLYFNHF